MQAIYINEYGNAEQLIVGNLNRPNIGPDQILIHVHGAGVNPVDFMVRNGFLQDSGQHQLPLILGWDAAGTVAEVGNNVSNHQLGDRVYVYAPIDKQGAYAEYLAVDADIVAPAPKSLDLVTAGAVPLAATTAWQALTQGCQLKAGDKVLIHNAAGGVGSFAVQIAKHIGAYVIGTASAGKAQFVKELGADEFIDYRSQDFREQVNDLDAVLAAVGGDDLLARSLAVIKPHGHLVSLLDELEPELAKAQKVNYQRWWVNPNAQDLQQISSLIDDGNIRVIIDTVFPMTQVQQAHALSESQRAQGKIVLNMQ